MADTFPVPSLFSDFKLEKTIRSSIGKAEEFIDWKRFISPDKLKKFKQTMNLTLDEDEKEQKELTQEGFLKKYGVDADTYDNLKWRKSAALKQPSGWRFTDTRLKNAIRELSSNTQNSQLLRMLQNHAGKVQSLKASGPRTRIPSTQTKFG